MKIIKNHYKMMIALVVFACAGAVLVVLTRAAQGDLGIESSVLTTSGSATTVSDQTASGDSYVEFRDGLSTEQQLQAIRDAGVVVIGDSLLHQSAYLFVQQDLQATGWQNITLSAQGCRSMEREHACGNVPSILVLEEILAQVQAFSYQNITDPNQGIVTIGDLNTAVRDAGSIVIALGTNDKPHSIALMEQKMRNSVSRLRALNPNADMHWVRQCNVPGRGNGSEDATIPALDSIAAELDIEVINWTNVCNASHLGSDGLHYNASGAAAYGHTIAAGVEPTINDL